jgi:hypothetical protein
MLFAENHIAEKKITEIRQAAFRQSYISTISLSINYDVLRVRVGVGDVGVGEVGVGG